MVVGADPRAESDEAEAAAGGGAGLVANPVASEGVLARGLAWLRSSLVAPLIATLVTADDGGSKFIVLFRTCAAAASCAQTRCLFELDLPARTSAAPHPRDVLWTNLYAPAARQQLVYFASRAALFALMLFWGSLVAFVQVRQEYTGQRRPQPKSQARRPARRPARRLTLPFLQGVVSLNLP